ncbi:uncharacterized protein DMAD_13605 [Drosophila madeirensis]|uniref:Secreted protein n=1 Tax=Drosophila madeirensis TaxID=30013 RepID=A0AAU9GG49_DROMD
MLGCCCCCWLPSLVALPRLHRRYGLDAAVSCRSLAGFSAVAASSVKDWMLLLLLVAGRLQVSLPWLRRR